MQDKKNSHKEHQGLEKSYTLCFSIVILKKPNNVATDFFQCASWDLFASFLFLVYSAD